MGKKSLLSIIAFVAGFAHGADTASLTWTAPTKNCDGTTLTNLSSYKIYWGTVGRVAAGLPASSTGACTDASQVLPTNPRVPQAYNQTPVLVASPTQLSQVINLNSPSTRYYFAVTALSSVGGESPLTNEVTKLSAASITNPVLGTPICTSCSPFTGLLLSGQTGATFTIVWNRLDVATLLEMYEYPPKVGAVPVFRANLAVGVTSFNWIPTRAGVYYTHLCGSTCVDSYNNGFLFYVKLAPPGGGGIGL